MSQLNYKLFVPHLGFKFKQKLEINCFLGVGWLCWGCGWSQVDVSTKNHRHSWEQAGSESSPFHFNGKFEVTIIGLTSTHNSSMS